MIKCDQIKHLKICIYTYFHIMYLSVTFNIRLNKQQPELKS